MIYGVMQLYQLASIFSARRRSRVDEESPRANEACFRQLTVVYNKLPLLKK